MDCAALIGHLLIVTLLLQMAKADLQQIAESLNQAQDTYKVLLDKRNALAKSVEKLKLLAAWQV